MKNFDFPPLFKRDYEKKLIFALLVLALLSPVWISALDWDSRLRFVGPASETENFPYYRQQIFENTSDLDFAFIGPCTVWWQVFPEKFKEKIQTAWNRPVEAVSFGFDHASADVTYLLVRQLLRHRSVKYLVLSTPRPIDDIQFPHPNAYQWWLYPEDRQDLGELSWGNHLKLYAMSVMGSFRTIPALLGQKRTRPEDLAHVSEWGTKKRDPANVSLAELKDEWDPKRAIFQNVGPLLQVATDSKGLPAEQMQFYRAIEKIAQEKGTQVVWLSSPLREDFKHDALNERIDWTREFPGTRLVGIPPLWIKSQNDRNTWEKLFQGENLTWEGARWMSEKWAESFASFSDKTASTGSF